MVIGFLAAVYIIRRLSRKMTPDPQLITNAALYSLMAGVAGARIFYVIHYFEQFQGHLLSVFAIWEGGLELLGGVIAAIVVIILYLRHHRLPVRDYLDILAIGLMTALIFGRVGCLLNGCCYGKPTCAAWAVRFPYDSIPYNSQITADTGRGRLEPRLKLPPEYFGYTDAQGWYHPDLKPREYLTDAQKQAVEEGEYRAIPVHPSQLYSSLSAVLMSIFLYLFWRRSLVHRSNPERKLNSPGSTFALMFILYGIMRFILELFRDDNPFENAWWIMYKGGTVSQNLGIYMIIGGIIMMIAFDKYNKKKLKT